MSGPGALPSADMTTMEFAVPERVWEEVLKGDSWVTQQGLAKPEFRKRGRGRQAVYDTDAATAVAIVDRIEEQSGAIADQQLRTRARQWARKTRDELGAPSSAPARRTASKGGAKRGGSRRRKSGERPEIVDAVRHYLSYVDTGMIPEFTSGRPEDKVQAEIATVETKLETTDDVLERLDLLQRRQALAAELEPVAVGSPEELEEAFVRHAGAYAAARGVTPAVFSEFGVADDVLARAGLGG